MRSSDRLVLMQAICAAGRACDTDAARLACIDALLGEIGAFVRAPADDVSKPGPAAAPLPVARA